MIRSSKKPLVHWKQRLACPIAKAAGVMGKTTADEEMKVSLFGGCEIHLQSLFPIPREMPRTPKHRGIIGSLWVPSYIASPPRWLTRLR